MKPEVTGERLEERAGQAGSDHDPLRTNLSAARKHVDRSAGELDALDRGFLEDQRVPIGGGGNQADAGAIRVNRATPLRSHARGPLERQLALDGSGGQRRRLDARGDPRLLIALEA